MKRAALLAPLPFLLAAAAGPAQLDWMEGRWTGTQDGVEMEEIWTSPSGGALLGMHKDVKGGRMVSFEFLRIEDTADGIVYLASPRARPPTPFKLVEQGHRRAVFARAERELPQRILYWLDDQGRLHARIEGERAGQPAAEEWTWIRSR
jgi:hypothetical protein